MDENRCEWAIDASPQEIRYHDTEWGTPSYDDRHLFEMLVLEGAQAGLSWATILKKREGYRAAFDNFDPCKMSHYSESKKQELLRNPQIVRNKRKIEAAIGNAKCFLRVRREFGNFSSYIWQFVGSKPIQNQWRSLKELPALTPESKVMSKDLKGRGFVFVGPTICYAFMQAVGMVNDHTVQCFRYEQLKKYRSSMRP